MGENNEEIYDRIKSFAAQSYAIDQKLDDLEREKENRIALLKADTKRKLEERQLILTRINAFISMAKTHSQKLYVSNTPLDVNIPKLSAISMKIDLSRKEDVNASKLFTEASGQKATIIRDINTLNNRLNDGQSQYSRQELEYRNQLRAEQSALRSRFIEYLQSNTFNSKINLLENARRAFQTSEDIVANQYPSIGLKEGVLALGYNMPSFPVPRDCEAALTEYSRGFYQNGRFKEFYCTDILYHGGVELWEESGECGYPALNSFIPVISQVGCHFYNQIKRIVFIDPVHMNGSALKCLEDLTLGEIPFIQVPRSMNEIERTLQQETDEINKKMMASDGRPVTLPDTLYIFNFFPDGYSNLSVKMIQQMCVNAHYNQTPIFLTFNIDRQTNRENTIISDIRPVIHTYFELVKNGNGKSFYHANNSQHPFIPFSYNGPCFPILLQRFLNREKEKTNNDYLRHVGLTNSFLQEKGTRKINNIPIGIDETGKLVSLDFEVDNFATFICGAAGSGKSTLLHTIITGLIQRNHPDDIEIWLVDFKMVEFSRYIKHLPPHIRYILLDNSPELSYDIIDRLTDILKKRQNMFRARWNSPFDVPKDLYMPQLFVIIDEFSIMSQIIQESESSSDGGYKTKFQNLLTNGRGLGFHFIFASQGFTTGVQGLTPLGKQQLQQRIAMKTEYAEIKETLDLRNVSDNDQMLMSQLETRHVLIRVPMDKKGNQLQHALVLYYPDYSVQEKWIDQISETVTPISQFRPYDAHTYISKKPLCIDGESYLSFKNRKAEIQEKIKQYRNNYGEGTLLFPGEPKRMSYTFPMEVYDSFCENIIMIAPVKENMTTASIIASCVESIRFQGKNVECLAPRKNKIVQILQSNCRFLQMTTKLDIDDICREIRILRDRIEAKQTGDTFYFLLGFESVLLEMSYAEKRSSESSIQPKIQPSAGVIRKEGQPSILTRIGINPDEIWTSTEDEEKVTPTLSKTAPERTGLEKRLEVTTVEKNEVYDAREDLKYIITYGPALGYHFFMVFNTVGEFEKSRMQVDLFAHKLMFQTARSNAMLLVGNAEGSHYERLAERCFRYTNGLQASSFRPFLHPGLSWDGWGIDENGEVTKESSEEEYLM